MLPHLRSKAGVVVWTQAERRSVFADVPHRQWVFTIPKRLRIYFRFDRALLGKLCHAAYDTVRDVYALEIDGNLGIPATCGELVEP
jgi:hypothetical protein